MSELKMHSTQHPALWHNNPVLVQLLGLSPLLAVSTSLINGLVLGIATGLVLVLASLTISFCRQLISAEWRYVIYMFVLAVFTTFIDLWLQQKYFALHKELGIYIPLICCNMALLLHLETQATKQSWQSATRNSLITAGGYISVLIGFAGIRELLISGHIGTGWQLLIPSAISQLDSTPLAAAPDWFRFARLTPAALLLLGFLIACRNLLTENRTAPTDVMPSTPVTRARVTGKIQDL